MKLREIEEIICNWSNETTKTVSDGVLRKPLAKEIYKLHLEDKINLLNSFNFEFCHECDNSGLVYSKLEELEQELKILEE